MSARWCRPACISCRPIRSPAPNIPAPIPGFVELFEGRWTLLTPLPGTDEAAIDKIEALWQRCGAQTERMEPATTTGCWRSFRICRI